MIRFILFDLDNTILDFTAGEDIALKTVFRDFGLEPSPEVIDRYLEINKGLWEGLEEGRVTREELSVERFSRLFSEFNISCSGKEVAKAYEKLLSFQHPFIPGAEEILRELSPHYELYIASNGTSEIQWRRIRDAKLERWFKGIFISEDMGVNKPDTGFFEKAFSEIEGFTKDQTLIVGDSLTSDIRGGRDAGIHTCLFAPGELPEREDIRPEYVIRKLSELPGMLSEM